MDDASRKRRARKALDALEQDNFHDDPHANLVMSKKAPKFDEALDGHTQQKQKERRRKTRSSEYFKQRLVICTVGFFPLLQFGVFRGDLVK